MKENVQKLVILALPRVLQRTFGYFKLAHKSIIYNTIGSQMRETDDLSALLVDTWPCIHPTNWYRKNLVFAFGICMGILGKVKYSSLHSAVQSFSIHHHFHLFFVASCFIPS